MNNELSVCCEASVTFVDTQLVCKKCYEPQPLEVLL